MAVNLIATARLNTGPYMKGLQQISGGTAGLAATTVATGKKTGNVWDDNERAAKAYERGVLSTGAAHAAAAANQAAQTKAMTDGTTAARNYASGLSALSADKLKLEAATERLSAAEGRLASSIARGRGVITPAVHAARAGVISAQVAYNKLADAQANVGRTGGSIASSLSSQRYLMHDLSRQATQYAIAFAAFPAASLIAGAAWEHNFASVIRTSDLKDNLDENMGKFNALRDSLVGMAQSMPASFGDITEVATLANQMGIGATETAEFTRAVIMFSESSGVSVDIAATAFGRLKSLVADVGSDYMGLADSILKVGVNSVSTEAEIINVTTQISSIAAQAGFTSKEMIGLSGALASVRVPPELSRGVVTRVFGQIDKAVSAGSTSLDTLARISGRTSEQFKAQWGTEGASGVLFRDLIRGLHEAGTAARSEIESLGITSVRDVPVLLRLANAADSDGNIGGLLTQTMKDAHDGAGETQKQYEIMAETVVGKLKILGNNIVAFFDAIGQSGLGSFGDMLDSLSKGIRNFTRDLDEPMKIFGLFELPWTNAEGLGFIAQLGLVAAGFSLIASMGTRLVASFVGAKQFGQMLSSSGILAAVKTGFSGGAVASALAPATKEVGKFSGALTTAGILGGRAIGTIAKAATGPVGIAIGLLALSGKLFADNFYEASMSADEFSSSLSGIDPDNMIALNKVLSDIHVSGSSDFWSKGEFTSSLKPFETGVDGYRAGIDALIEARNAGEAGGWSRDKWWTSWGFQLSQSAARSGKGLMDEVKGMQLVDDAIQGLVDSGNGERAITLVRNLHGTLDQLKYTMESTEGKAIKDLMENTFNAAGIEMTDANLYKFVNGSLKELSAALTGFDEGDKVANALFGGDIEEMGKFANVIDEAAAAFIDFGAALEAGWFDADGEELKNFSLSNYTSELKKSVKAQKEWAEDLQTVAEYASTGLLQHLAELGPDAAPLFAALADELGEGVTTSLDELEEVFAEKTAGLGNALAESLANRAWIRRAVGDDGLAGLLQSELGDDKMSQLYDAARGVGSETITAVMEGLARGNINFGQAMRLLFEAQPIKPTVKLDEDSLDRGLAVINAKLSRTKFSPQIDAETTMSEFKSSMNNTALNSIEIDGNLTLEKAYATSREFQVWAERAGIDIYLGADDLPARLSLAALLAYGNDQKIQIEIDGLPEPGKNAVWEIVTLADESRGYVQIDGKNKLALDKVYQIDEATGEPMIIELDAEEQEAINKILAVRTEAASKPAVIEIEGADSKAKRTIAALTGYQGTASISVYANKVGDGWHAPMALPKADGGVVSYYANGGVRENHVAQIAPAGSMRIWAESETGGEAYIPLAKSKRARSEAILNDVAQRFGYSLTNATKYADGGYYHAQQQSRVINRNSAGRGGERSYEKATNFNMTIVNPETRDPIKQAWDQSELWGNFSNV